MITTKRKTKIIATLGPASSSESMIAALIEAGVDVFRMNFSHGVHAEKGELLQRVRMVSQRLGRAVAVLADLQGPKIRTGHMEGGQMPLVKGETVQITTREILGRDNLFSTVYAGLPRDVKPGARILLDDGLMELKVLEVSGENVRCRVVEGGILKNNKGINLPGVDVSAPSLSEKDLGDLSFILQSGFDYVALSFVRRGSDVERLKRIMYEQGSNLPVVAKIEKPEGLKNFREILAVSDAIMVARGDLGVELHPERVPLVQKRIIRECNEAGKPVITATQMLESMISHARPTRAETSDVANAILDGTDAVMLSGETAAGAYPLQAVQTMVNVAVDVEHAELWRESPRPLSYSNNVASAVAGAACQAAATLKASAIVVMTQSGSSACLLSKFRPQLPIIAFTASTEVQRRLALWWGVRSQPLGALGGADDLIPMVEETLLKNGFRKGDLIVIIMGIPMEARGSTNMMRVYKLGTGWYYEVF
ncbi:pyruvate kinase [Geomonas sp. RF6]|uniref:pyruvate kinase n=1 Tax=Geomonas sp. RF6 TaxID=2897342 RepID=UPI001E415F2E|nr:pyruvate kinase [Geomonas sp. RF6]UFS71973.1 pyruvate kinase [Geomonas sp. RF6]